MAPSKIIVNKYRDFFIQMTVLAIIPDLIFISKIVHSNISRELKSSNRSSAVTTPDIIDAYAELLRKKRAEEKMYRYLFPI